jgi:hypothetical protein
MNYKLWVQKYTIFIVLQRLDAVDNFTGNLFFSFLTAKVRIKVITLQKIV